MSFTREELYEINDALTKSLHGCVNRGRQKSKSGSIRFATCGLHQGRSLP